MVMAFTTHLVITSLESKAEAFNDFQYITNNIVHCNSINLHFFLTFIMLGKNLLKG